MGIKNDKAKFDLLKKTEVDASISGITPYWWYNQVLNAAGNKTEHTDIGCDTNLLVGKMKFKSENAK